jgi:hypothetical protein
VAEPIYGSGSHVVAVMQAADPLLKELPLRESIFNRATWTAVPLHPLDSSDRQSELFRTSH